MPASLIVLFGALPATWLCWFAFLGLWAFLPELMKGHFAALLFVAWGIFGFFGAISLWLAAFGKRGTIVCCGLIAGSVAVIPILANATFQGNGWTGKSINIAAMTTVAVASILLLATAKRKLEQSLKKEAIGHRYKAF